MNDTAGDQKYDVEQGLKVETSDTNSPESDEREARRRSRRHKNSHHKHSHKHSKKHRHHHKNSSSVEAQVPAASKSVARGVDAAMDLFAKGENEKRNPNANHLADADYAIATVMENTGVTIAVASKVLDESGGDAESAMVLLSGKDAARLQVKSSSQKTPHKSNKTSHRRDYEEDGYSNLKPDIGYSHTKTELKKDARVSSEQRRTRTGRANGRKGAGEDKTLAYPIQEEQNVSPSPSLMAAVVANPPHTGVSNPNAAHTSPRDIESTFLRPTDSARPRGIRPPLPTPPGAVAVAGPDPSNSNYDDYSVTAPQQEAVFDNAMSPVTATLVHGDEGDFEAMQEQLRQQDQELQRMRAAQQNVAVAQVIAQNTSNDEDSTTDGKESPSSDLCKPFLPLSTRRKLIVGIVAILIIVGIVVGVVLSSNSDPRPPTLTEPPTLVSPTASPTMEPTEPGNWSLMGEDLVGNNNGDIFGASIAMSANGEIIAVGAPFHDSNSFEWRGGVYFYVWNETAWNQLGGVVYGEKAGDFFGWPVALSSDGTVMAAGARHSGANGDSSGQVRVFQFVNDGWSQVGSSLNGANTGDHFGSYMLDLSADGSVLAVGALNNDGPEGADPDCGSVYVFSWDGSMWGQLGEVLYGKSSGDLFGHSVALSANATMMAVGAPRNDNNGVDSGNVQTFRLLNDQWAEVGTGIDGVNAQDWFGQSVALSADGAVLAVGAPFAKVDGIGLWSGHARVFRLVNDDWTQVGSTLIDENEDEFGSGVALSSDGTILVVAALKNDINGEESGQVRVFRFIDNDWIQVGNAMNGKGADDTFGHSVAMSANGMTVAGGAPQWEKDGDPPGYVMVYRTSLEDQ